MTASEHHPHHPHHRWYEAPRLAMNQSPAHHLPAMGDDLGLNASADLLGQHPGGGGGHPGGGHQDMSDHMSSFFHHSAAASLAAAAAADGSAANGRPGDYASPHQRAAAAARYYHTQMHSPYASAATHGEYAFFLSISLRSGNAATRVGALACLPLQVGP